MTWSAYFDGIDDVVPLGDLALFEDKDGGFITWLYLPDVVGDHVVFSEYNSAGAHHVTLTVKGATLEAVAHDGTNTTTLTGGTLTAETWHHVALVADATDLLLYVDGALVDSDTLPALALTLDTAALGSDGTDYLFGALSQFRGYATGPTAAEVLADYEAGDWPPDTAPVEERPLFDGLLAVLCGTTPEDVATAATKLRYTTTAPGGFGEASFRLPASSPFSAYSLNVVRTAPVVIEHDTQTLFEGVITKDVAQATIDEGTAYYDVVAAGKWFEAGQRADGMAAYCDMDFGQWEISHRGQPEQFNTDLDGRLAIIAKRGRQFNSPGGGAGPHYWMHKGLGDPTDRIDHIIFELGDYGDGNGRGLDLALSGDWRMSVQTGENPWDTAMAAEDLYSPPQQIAAGTFFRSPNEGIGYTFGVLQKCVRFRLYPINDNTPSADRYLVVQRIWIMYTQHERIVSSCSSATPSVVTTSTDHGLKTGDRVYLWGGDQPGVYQGVHQVLSTPSSTTFTVAVGGTAATGGYMERIPSPVDAMKDIGEAIGGVSASIDDACYAAALPGSVMVRPYTPYADALAELERQFSVPVVWGWWDGGEFQMDTLDVSSPTVTYEVDCSDPGVSYNVQRDTEGQPEFVRVLYTLDDPTDELHGQVVQTVVGPSDPGYSIDSSRVAVLDLSGTPLTTADAEDIGQRYLDAEGTDTWVGTIVVKTPTVDLVAGGTYPTPYIRAGVWIREASALDACYITTTEYDADASTMTLTIGHPPEPFDPERAARKVPT